MFRADWDKCSRTLHFRREAVIELNVYRRATHLWMARSEPTSTTDFAGKIASARSMTN